MATMTIQEACYIVFDIVAAELARGFRGHHHHPVSALRGYDIVQICTAFNLVVANEFLLLAGRDDFEKDFAETMKWYECGPLQVVGPNFVADDEVDAIVAKHVFEIDDPRFLTQESTSSFAEYCKRVGADDPVYWQKIYMRLGLEYTSSSPAGNEPVEPTSMSHDVGGPKSAENVKTRAASGGLLLDEENSKLLLSMVKNAAKAGYHKLADLVERVKAMAGEHWNDDLEPFLKEQWEKVYGREDAELDQKTGKVNAHPSQEVAAGPSPKAPEAPTESFAEMAAATFRAKGNAELTFPRRREFPMRVAGRTLIVMAVILHFSACEWEGNDSSRCIVPFLPFVQAREVFATHHKQGRFDTDVATYNTVSAGLWGLVIPLGLAVAGICLSRRDPRPTILRSVVGWPRRAGRTVARVLGGDLRRVGGWLLRLLTALNDTPAAAIERGNAAIEAENWDLAIANYTEAIRLNPNYAVEYNNRGIAYRHKGDYDQAIADYTEAIRLDPKYSRAYNNRGWAYGEKDDYDQAIADYTEAIRLDPDYADAYSYRGWAYWYKGDTEKSIQDYTEVIRLDPKFAAVYKVRGGMYLLKRDWDNAIADYTAAIRLDPDYADGYRGRGGAYRHKGDYDKAIADLTEAIRLDPKNALAYYDRGFAYEGKCDWHSALADLNEAIRLDPNDGRFYSVRGRIYGKTGQEDIANKDFAKAEALGCKPQ